MATARMATVCRNYEAIAMRHVIFTKAGDQIKVIMKYISESVHEIDHEIISTVILLFRLVKKDCSCPKYCLTALSCLPRKMCGLVVWPPRHDNIFDWGVKQQKSKAIKKYAPSAAAPPSQTYTDLALRKIRTIHVVRILIELAKLTLCLLTHSADTLCRQF